MMPAVWVSLLGLPALRSGSTMSATGPAARLSRASRGPPRAAEPDERRFHRRCRFGKGRQVEHPAKTAGARVLVPTQVLRLLAGSANFLLGSRSDQSAVKCRQHGTYHRGIRSLIDVLLVSPERTHRVDRESRHKPDTARANLRH